MVYAVLVLLLRGIIGFFPEVIGCLVGSWLSTYFLGTRDRTAFSRTIPAAIGVVVATFIAIDIAHVVGRLVRGTPTSWEPLTLLFWAVVATSWWLVPATAAIRAALNRASRA
jgi:uncharacterized membrane protein YeaQ/YmgE (transglycosylase-associated protein family)